MNRTVKIFASPFELAEALAIDIVKKITDAGTRKPVFSIALTGGNTPDMLFSILGDHFAGSVNWNSVHFFWVDERCVPPDDPESNYGMVRAAFLNKIKIAENNIHRMKGEDDPVNEANRYANTISEYTVKNKGLPAFDITLLGLGEDGHIASIFPGSEIFFSSGPLCLPAVHPVTGQNRITLSGRVINNSRIIYFMVTGKNKAEIVKNILYNKTGALKYPASFIVPVDGEVFWYLDAGASGSLTEETGNE